MAEQYQLVVKTYIKDKLDNLNVDMIAITSLSQLLAYANMRHWVNISEVCQEISSILSLSLTI